MTKRADGREAKEIIQPNCKIGTLTGADGSSYVERGGTKILCSVHGPRQAMGDFDEKAQVNVKWSTTTFAGEKYTRLREQTEESWHISSGLEEVFTYSVILESYPKSIIDISFVVLEDDGCIFPLSVLAGSLALANAGIELHDVPTCASAAIMSDSVMVIDPSENESHMAQAAISVTALTAHGTILSVQQTGVTSSTQSEAAIKLCYQTCDSIRNIVRKVLEEQSK
eukprot:TRINITY_DN17047_c0_g1_i2.p1 TRINITY_DN17047_c0_g1~~TRINITY_DN17047_c0_g1_i2.p1  ORF type:complete len:233 (+),score=41.12 TRINITY_DN17047_c0_g1_i2:23-700(+)